MILYDYKLPQQFYYIQLRDWLKLVFLLFSILINPSKILIRAGIRVVVEHLLHTTDFRLFWWGNDKVTMTFATGL